LEIIGYVLLYRKQLLHVCRRQTGRIVWHGKQTDHTDSHILSRRNHLIVVRIGKLRRLLWCSSNKSLRIGIVWNSLHSLSLSKLVVVRNSACLKPSNANEWLQNITLRRWVLSVWNYISASWSKVFFIRFSLSRSAFDTIVITSRIDVIFELMLFLQNVYAFNSDDITKWVLSRFWFMRKIFLSNCLLPNNCCCHVY